MKQLLLARHAKSDWGDASVRDFDRELNERGLMDAPRMGRWLAEKGIKPKVILTSPARRALHTAEMLAEGMGVSETFIFHEPRIYEAHTGALQEIVEETDDSIESLMLVGHNPAMTQLVNILGGEPLNNLPTCSVVALEFQVEHWADIRANSAFVSDVWRAKDVLRGP